MNTSKILLLDDEPQVLNALSLNLKSKFDIHKTTSPCEALKLLREEGPFQVVVSDFRMPEMNGLEFLLEVNKICPETSSVLLTGQGEYDTAINALNSGKIFKYLSKPCTSIEISNVLKEGINNFKNEVNKKHALKEYEVAKIVQDQMLFSKFRPVNEHIDLTALSTPKSGVCGDFYEIIPHSKDCFDILIADVMGKGLPAAIIGAAVKNSFLHELQVLKAKSKEIPSISDIMKSLEEEIHDSLVEARMFITLLFARVDLKSMSISYISNGHPGSLVIRENSCETIYLQSTHMPLGIQKRDYFKSVNFNLKPMDKLVFYTDGISEALVEMPSDDPLELIFDCLDGGESTTDEIASKIFNKAKSKRGIQDDMTVISMNLSNKLGEVKPVTLFLQKRLDEIYRINSLINDLPGDSDDLFIVALIETFTNIVKHAEECEASVKMVCSVDDLGKMKVQFVYNGSHFKPDSIKLPDCTQQVNGFGLYLIEKICGSVTYTEEDNQKSLITLVSK